MSGWLAGLLSIPQRTSRTITKLPFSGSSFHFRRFATFLRPLDEQGVLDVRRSSS